MTINPHLSIFIVDDDTLCVTLYHQFLKQIGYSKIYPFDNGEDCLASFKEKKPDMVILDYNMEGMNGMEVFQAIKKIEPSTLVYFISGQEDISTALATIKEGALDYIVKAKLNPEKMAEIMRHAEEHLASKLQNKSNSTVFKRFFGKS